MAGEHHTFTSVEICAGAGGQAIGLENAGFRHLALVEIDPHACATLAANSKRMGWGGNIFEGDVRDFDPAAYDIKPATIDLLAGGVPCPPFSLAGKQLGQEDERDLFPVMLDLVQQLQPKAVMIENVRGLLQDKFFEYREHILDTLRSEGFGYVPVFWDVLNASNFGTSQLRPRSILVAVKPEYAPYFPQPRAVTTAETDDDMIPGTAGAGKQPIPTKTVGQALRASMRRRGLEGKDLDLWVKKADRVAPTLVGGSKKHGGADLGPTRAKRQWEQMGVDGHGVADDDEMATLDGPKGRGPRLTVKQAALLQGFPEKWEFSGGKTAQYRQVGNAFPPPVAQAVASCIMAALTAHAEGREPLSGQSAPGGALLPRPRSAARSLPATRVPSSEEQTSLLP
ncbi:DNA cytosine methyltransferase [Actinospica durhamensis]|uniref:Cytosine-specific methyltransferase n=1 Tax=Actinospica durhamensis TaxID=1508375 RepID=A0A941IM69_9ACTN|nr:DNA (cytosine-5-)-methyltransferase [Actinospica durhamensis]MBR7833820.1 DNA cytosine methyltransferase [Actinospica durhamensis]